MIPRHDEQPSGSSRVQVRQGRTNPHRFVDGSESLEDGDGPLEQLSSSGDVPCGLTEAALSRERLCPLVLGPDLLENPRRELQLTRGRARVVGRQDLAEESRGPPLEVPIAELATGRENVFEDSTSRRSLTLAQESLGQPEGPGATGVMKV